MTLSINILAKKGIRNKSFDIPQPHYTLDRNLPGPDHFFALEPNELKDMVEHIRDIERAKGSGIKDKSELEADDVYQKARRSIHAKVDMPKGTIITKDMLRIKRPGYGLKPKCRRMIRKVGQQ